MLEFFKSILTFLATIGQFVESIVTGLFSMLQMIPQSMEATTNIIAFMPSQLAVYATAGIAICVVFHIIGR